METYRLVAVLDYGYDKPLTFTSDEECRDEAQAVAWAHSWAVECRVESMDPKTPILECYAVKVSELNEPEDEQVRHYLPYETQKRLGIIDDFGI